MYCYKLPSQNCFLLHPTMFNLFSFSFVWRLFISLLISSLTQWLFRSILPTLQIFVDLLIFLLLLISTFVSLWSREDNWYDFSLLIFYDMLYNKYNQSWRIFHVYLKISWILLLLDRMFCICPLSPIILKSDSVPNFLIDFLTGNLPIVNAEYSYPMRLLCFCLLLP